MGFSKVGLEEERGDVDVRKEIKPAKSNFLPTQTFHSCFNGNRKGGGCGDWDLIRIRMESSISNVPTSIILFTFRRVDKRS